MYVLEQGTVCSACEVAPCCPAAWWVERTVLSEGRLWGVVAHIVFYWRDKVAEFIERSPFQKSSSGATYVRLALRSKSPKIEGNRDMYCGVRSTVLPKGSYVCIRYLKGDVCTIASSRDDIYLSAS